jgi:DNA-binding transcriptional ArsR family regulator
MAGALQRFKADFFKALAHPTRIRILELLIDGEKSVSELQLLLGPDGAAVSQQLAILRMKNIVDNRRAGTSIYYRLRDPQVKVVLDAARRMFDASVGELRSVMDEVRAEDRRNARAAADALRRGPRGASTRAKAVRNGSR